VSTPTTRRLKILENRRKDPIQWVSPNNFMTEPGEPIDPQEILQNPAYTFYCFHPENDSVIFVESDDPKAVDTAPFYYQGQAETAVSLVEMPFETFVNIGEQIPKPSNGLVIIHSVGRCGSTLLSKLLDSVSTVHSLSEPDDWTQLVFLRQKGDLSDKWFMDSLRASAQWRCKPRLGSPPDTVALKTRSEVLALADLMSKVFANDKHIFLYREGVSWMGSIIKNWSPDRDIYNEEKNRASELSWSSTLPIVKEYIRPEKAMNPVQVRILAWITCMEGYLQLREAGLDIIAARFEELTGTPTETLQALMEFCRIDGVDWSAVDDVLSRDSQAGTVFAQEVRKRNTIPYTESMKNDVREMIQTRPLLGSSEVILPGTVGRSD